MREFLLKNARVVDPARNLDAVMDLGVADGRMTDPGKLAAPEIVDLKGLVAAPGFIDMHVHLRQPGNTGAETIATGTAAAAAGGFTAVVAMPNTNPAADTPGAIEFLHRNAQESGVVKVLPTGCMTKGFAGEEMAPIGGLKNAGVVALTDDGHCIQNHALMRHVVEYAKEFGLPILDHCEEKTLFAGGSMHEGKWSVLLGMKGISPMSEELIVARNVMLARSVGWSIHMQHLSSHESVRMLREARKNGIRVTGEATPHHIALTDECVKSFNTNYKMNPPLGSERDRQALIAGLADGTITVIATDHAPHTQTAKQVEFDYAPCGIIGLETAVGVTMKLLVAEGVLPLSGYVAKFTTGPAEALRLPERSLADGNPADVTILDPDRKWVVDASKFKSKSRNTPFNGYECVGKAVGTIVDGRWVHREF